MPKQFVAVILTLLSTTLHATPWETVAADRFKLLWKELTYTQLQVDPRQEAPANNDILSPGYSKQIIIEYALSVSAERFRDLTQEQLEDTYDDAQLAPHRDDIARFNSWYLGVEKGDRYQLRWQTDVGLQLQHNDTVLGTLQDPEAAKLILSVWLGPAAVSESQRDRFLDAWQQELAAR
ncbi:chalcone isomerase family protein [Spongiibacter tropicus]|jgi:hypothetical protein|uniref:chalcone isomerase family protein n=1 Tax=Spongiibacter tropicus TaxID=454602 RepID=UPI00259945F1|nr:chalcone isomerase family protein [uncultured Spongiibacter sp.]|tara:strand:- start:70 stop:606 length:537 start_codon:yes stop_codon:yes gene_type:complete